MQICFTAGAAVALGDQPAVVENSAQRLRIAAGAWDSERFELRPGYYRLEVTGRCGQAALWALLCEDAAGEELGADVCDSMFASSDARTDVYCPRVHPLATRGRLRVWPLAGDVELTELRLEPTTSDEATDWLRAQQATWRRWPAPPQPIGQGLEATRAALRAGRPWRVVMLGDSIINDTSNGLPELWLRSLGLPGLEITTSVRGGTGCPWYREEGRVAEYVLRHQPDLVVIGGISNGYDHDAVANVARQVRDGSAAEILLLTGLICPVERCQPEREPGYRDALRGLAEGRGLAFCDLRGLWDAAVEGVDQDWYLRDPVHANCRGKALASWLLAAAMA